MLPCPRCGAPADAADRACRSCGSEFKPAASVEIGDVLEEKYRIEARIGKGGMGSVWRAHDLALERPVAIKLVDERLRESAEALMRFKREGLLMAKLDHPNLIPVHTVGNWRGMPFIVMKLLDGVPLSELSRTRQFRLVEIASITSKVCSALGCLHQHEIVHRDVKPANIMVGPNDEVTLLDLGVARDMETSVTETGAQIGTRGYMAPEQFYGKRVDHRCDIYAMGAVIYELVSGKRLFDSRDDAIPAAPPRIPGLAEPIWEVIDRALAVNPRWRFHSAVELAEKFQAAVTGRPDDIPSPDGEALPLTRDPPAMRAEPRRKVETTVILPPTGMPLPAPALSAPVLSARPATQAIQSRLAMRRTRGMLIAGAAIAMIASVSVPWMLRRLPVPTQVEALAARPPPLSNLAPVAGPPIEVAPSPGVPDADRAQVEAKPEIRVASQVEKKKPRSAAEAAPAAKQAPGRDSNEASKRIPRPVPSPNAGPSSAPPPSIAPTVASQTNDPRCTSLANRISEALTAEHRDLKRVFLQQWATELDAKCKSTSGTEEERRDKLNEIEMELNDLEP